MNGANRIEKWAAGKSSMRESVATVVGFLAASMFPAAMLSVLTPLGGELSLGSAAGSFAVAYPFSAAFTFLFGIPTFLLLRRFSPGRWWVVLVVGFALGMSFQSCSGCPVDPIPTISWCTDRSLPVWHSCFG